MIVGYGTDLPAVYDLKMFNRWDIPVVYDIFLGYVYDLYVHIHVVICTL